MQTHNPPHVCSICEKTFSRKSSLKKHMQKFHPKPTTAVTTESHEEPAGTVTTTTHSFSTDSSTISVSYIQPPNTETKVPIQVVTQLTGPIETTTVMQSSETISDSQSVDDFDTFQEKLARGLPDLE
ncbi:C2H2-type zinc finger protein [Endozoicomonas euniceicola]|uniref:C2H2-type zinc finger protein n=2 Tax=Endozoicomonas euniceicola TaxID=1234143 RepID=A0ABY6GRI9_9GAMM|nr:C2H2-type zinc finger protein [Endozoicomonas euniceicola]UYM15368.1 C2H2-type zinc finger protein [Endozoicomonas euniceicola]